MKTLLSIEHKARKAFFTRLWKVLDVHSLTDLVMIILFFAASSAVSYVFLKGLAAWLYR